MSKIKPFDKGKIGNEAFNGFFIFFKRWLGFASSSSDSVNFDILWEKMTDEAINLTFNTYSENTEGIIRKVDNTLGTFTRVLEPLTILTYSFERFIEQHQKEGIAPLELDIYKDTFTKVYGIFKKYQEIYASPQLMSEYRSSKSDFLRIVKKQYKGKDEFFISLIETMFYCFEKSEMNYKKFLSKKREGVA